MKKINLIICCIFVNCFYSNATLAKSMNSFSKQTAVPSNSTFAQGLTITNFSKRLKFNITTGEIDSIVVKNLTASSFELLWFDNSLKNKYILDICKDSLFTKFVVGFKHFQVRDKRSISIKYLEPSTTYYIRLRTLNDSVCFKYQNILSITTKEVSGCDPSLNASRYPVLKLKNGIDSITWITRNLGATTDAESLEDFRIEAAGCYYQFNRKQPLGVNFIWNATLSNPEWMLFEISENSNWTFENDPCAINLGFEWRLPTESEWMVLLSKFNWKNSFELYSSDFRLHLAGYLSNEDGILMERGVTGGFWSSNQHTLTEGMLFGFGKTEQLYIMNARDKAHGYNVRCVQSK